MIYNSSIEFLVYNCNLNRYIYTIDGDDDV